MTRMGGMDQPTTRRDALRLAGVAGLAALVACSRQPARQVPATAARTSAASATPAAPGPAAGGPAVQVVNGARTRQQVALTFHGAGDPALAEALLAEAERADARVTVFAVCQWLDQHPAMAARITGKGHALANHTYTHPDLGRLSVPAVDTEITRARDVLTRLTGGNGGYFRPSAMDRATDLVLAEAGRAGYATVVAFDVDPHDYQDPGARAVIDRTLGAVAPGSIVSLHLGHPGTVQALPDILSGLHARGLAAVTVHDLLT